MNLASLFDSVTIQSAPGNRPIGTGGGFPDETDNLMSPKSFINKKTKNGWVGTNSKQVVKDNQFLNTHQFDPTKGTPLTVMGDSIGNIGDLAITCPTNIGEIGSDAMNHVMNVLNGKVEGEMEGKLTAEQIRYMGEKGAMKKPSSEKPEFQLMTDYAAGLHGDTRMKMIRAAVGQGFTEKEATEAYEKMRQKEAEIALRKAENPTYQLYDMIDSKGGGGVDKREPSNNESALNLAMGGQGNPRVAPPETFVKPRGIGGGRPRKYETKEQAKSRRISAYETNLAMIQAEHDTQNILEMMEEIKKESKGK